MVCGWLFVPMCEAISVVDIQARWKTIQEATCDREAAYDYVLSGTFLPEAMVESGILYQKGVYVRKDVQKPQVKTVWMTPTEIVEKDMRTGKKTRSKRDTPFQHDPFGMTNPYGMCQSFSLEIVTENATWIELKGVKGSSCIQVLVRQGSYVIDRLRLAFEDQPYMALTMAYSQLDPIAVVTSIKEEVWIRTSKQIQKMEMIQRYQQVRINQGLTQSLFRDVDGI